MSKKLHQKYGESTSGIPPMRPLQIMDKKGNDRTDAFNKACWNLMQLIQENIQLTNTQDIIQQLEEEKYENGKSFKPAEWARQHDTHLIIKPDGLKAASRVDRLYQLEIITKLASFVNQPDDRKKEPSYPLSLNLGAADKAMREATVDTTNNLIYLSFKCYDDEYLLSFRLPQHMIGRNIIKINAPIINWNHDLNAPVFCFSITEKTAKRKKENKNLTAGYDDGRVEPFILVIRNDNGKCIATYHASKQLIMMNNNREALIKEVKELRALRARVSCLLNGRLEDYSAKLELREHYDKLTEEISNKSSKAERIGRSIARKQASEIRACLRKHPMVSDVNAEELSWATGEEYGSRWNHGEKQDELAHQVNKDGVRVNLVNPAGTSSHCYHCGGDVRLNTMYRVAVCDACRIIMDRDWNAAMIIARRGSYDFNSKPVPERVNGNNCNDDYSIIGYYTNGINNYVNSRCITAKH